MTTLRRVRDGDALALLALERALAADGRGMVKGLDDLPDHPADIDHNVREWLSLARWRGVRFVQETEAGEIVGEGSLRRLGPSMIDHVAVLALGIHPAAQGQGLGRAMMNALLAWARSPPAHPSGRARPVRRVELYVRADNDRAQALYQSLGFTVEGRRARFVRLPGDRFVDDLVMGLWLG
jgi:putative acetyltransferase